MSFFYRCLWGLFTPNDKNDDHPHASELGRVVGAAQDDQQAGIHPPNIGNDVGARQGMAAVIGLDSDGGGGGGVADQHAVELQAAEEGDIQDENRGGDGGYSSSRGDAGQHAVGPQAAEERNIQDDNGIGDGGNAGQGVADPQHGGDATIDGDGIGNGDDARRLRLRRLRKLLLFLMLEVVRLAALFYVKTVFLEDSLSLFHVLRLCVGIVLIGVSILIECLLLRGVVNDAEADLFFTWSRRVMRIVRYLLILLILLC